MCSFPCIFAYFGVRKAADNRYSEVPIIGVCQ